MTTRSLFAGWLILCIGALSTLGALVDFFERENPGEGRPASQDDAIFILFPIALAVLGVVLIRANRSLKDSDLISKGSRRRAFRKISSTIAAVLEEHADTLQRRWRNATRLDDYGTMSGRARRRDLDHVRDDLIWPAIKAAHSTERIRKAITTYFSTLRGAARDYYESRFQRSPLAAAFNAYLDHRIESLAEDGEEIVSPTCMFDPNDFERYCAEILRGSGWQATVQGGSGDQGVDIIAERDGVRAVFQCKCYSSPVGNTAVQEVFAGQSIFRADLAYVVSNAGYTPGAQEAARGTGVVLLGLDDLHDLPGWRS